MKLTRHSINLIIIANLIICYLAQMHLAVNMDSPFYNMHRFMQNSEKTNNMLKKISKISNSFSTQNKINSKVPIFYDVDLYTIKAQDPIGSNYKPYTSKIALQNEIEFYEENKVISKMPFQT